MFKNDPIVSFGDVDWSQENFDRAFGVAQGPGDNGWPTIRYFNTGTGYGGKAYKKKTDESMDAELGDRQKMQEYVEEKSGSSFCDVVWGTDCSEMELKYISKWAGPNVPRDLASIKTEKDKWSQLLRTEAKNFPQKQQRILILSRLAENFANPEL